MTTATTDDNPKPPSGTTMEGMVYNANHVLDLALHPGIKKSCNILDGAKGVVILNTIEVGVVFAGTRGSGVVLAKNDKGEWTSAPSAVTLTTLKLGWIVGIQDKGVIVVFPTEEGIDNFLSGQSLEIGGGMMTGNSGPQQVNSFVTSKGKGSCYVYTYKVPNSFESVSVEGVTIKHQNKANERFYGKAALPFDIVRKDGVVTVPEGTGVPELHRKLTLLEQEKEVEPSPELEKNKELLRKAAGISEEQAAKEIKGEVEAVDAVYEKNTADAADDEKKEQEEALKNIAAGVDRLLHI